MCSEMCSEIHDFGHERGRHESYGAKLGAFCTKFRSGANGIGPRPQNLGSRGEKTENLPNNLDIFPDIRIYSYIGVGGMGGALFYIIGHLTPISQWLRLLYLFQS